MLLNEHQEHYEQRGQPKLVGKPKNEEFTMIRDVIMLPHMLTLSDKSLQDVQLSTLVASRC